MIISKFCFLVFLDFCFQNFFRLSLNRIREKYILRHSLVAVCYTTTIYIDIDFWAAASHLYFVAVKHLSFGTLGYCIWRVVQQSEERGTVEV